MNDEKKQNEIFNSSKEGEKRDFSSIKKKSAIVRAIIIIISAILVAVGVILIIVKRNTK